MDLMSIDEMEVIKEYKSGKSMNTVAREFGTYATTVKRILEKHGVDIRRDFERRGILHVKDGDKLIEWAKAQGRLVTRNELAAVLGRSKLSPSYFIKYPELGQYVASDEQKEFKEYYDKLYTWLKSHNISYKPNDRTKLGVSVDVLLLDEYADIALQIIEKPKTVSIKNHEESLARKSVRAHEKGIKLVGLSKRNFDDDLRNLESVLKSLKK